MLRCASRLLRKRTVNCRLLSSSATLKMASGRVKQIRNLDGLEKNVWIEFTALVRELQPVNLGQGMPDYSPPQFVLDALAKSTETASNNQYTRGPGHPRLVKVLGELYSKVYGRTIDPNNEIVVTLGAYSSLSQVTRAFLEPGDEVVIVEPYFDCYVPMTKLCGAKPVFVPLRPQSTHPTSSKDYALDPAELEAAFTDKTKMLIFNTPHNPTGKVFTKAELEVIADVCRRHDVLCVSDEVYEWLVYSGSEHVKIATLPGMWERTVTIGSAGKTFHATGWKTGWSVGPEQLIVPMQLIGTHTGYNLNTPIQEALAVGFEQELPRLGQPDSYLSEMVRRLEGKRDAIVSVLQEIGMEPVVPDGGYLLMADTSTLGVEFPSGGDEAYDFQFAKWLMREKGLSSIPPSAFYSPEHEHMAGKFTRFCFAKEESTLEAAYKILRQWAQERKNP